MISSCGGSEETSNQQGNSRFGGQGGFGAQRVTSVEAKPVERGEIFEQVKSFGILQSQNTVAITPQVSNRITNVYVDLGDRVRAGQVLAKIYDATAKDQLAQAEAQISQSEVALNRDRSQLERQRQLLDKELISVSEYEISEATYRQSLAQFESANAQLTQAKEAFNNTEVKAPIDGLIVSRTAEVGDIAAGGQPLFELSGSAGFESRIFLPVGDWRAIQVGQEVALRVSSEKEATGKGVISRKSPQLDPTTGLGEVVVTLTQTGNSLFPGVLTENVINIQSKTNAIVIPRSAMVEKVETFVEPESNSIQLSRNYYAFVAKGDSVAEMRLLTLGIQQGDKIEVLQGLSVADKIVTTGQQTLQDGSRIRVSSGLGFQAAQPNTIATDDSNARPQAQGQRPGGNPLANLSEEERAKVQKATEGMNPQERRAYFQQYRDSVQTANSGIN